MAKSDLSRREALGRGLSALRRARPRRSMIPRVRLPARDQRGNVSAGRALWRIGMSLLRRRWQRFVVVSVDIGSARVHADLRTPLGLGLYRYGFHAVEARVCAALLRRGDVFVDGGANIGLFALRGASVVGSTGRVLACEPAPGTMRLLRANVQHNHVPWVDLHALALSDEVGTANFTVFEDGSGLASFAPPPGAGLTVEVAVETLDRLTSPFGRGVALVKLDVEGAEAKALEGASELIVRSAPLFLIEVEPDHLARQGSSIDDLMHALQPHGYEAYAITPKARLRRLEGPWRPPDPSCPNLVLASPARSARLRGLIAPSP